MWCKQLKYNNTRAAVVFQKKKKNYPLTPLRRQTRRRHANTIAIKSSLYCRKDVIFIDVAASTRVVDLDIYFWRKWQNMENILHLVKYGIH